VANQFGLALRTSMANELAIALDGGAIRLFSSVLPVDCQQPDPVGVLASGTLPAPAATAALGEVLKSGSWLFTGSAAGDAQSFRVYDSALTCLHQGTISLLGGGGDMIIDKVSITIGQAGEVISYNVIIGGS
jgi:hypothetical protein